MVRHRVAGYAVVYRLVSGLKSGEDIGKKITAGLGVVGGNLNGRKDRLA